MPSHPVSPARVTRGSSPTKNKNDHDRKTSPTKVICPDVSTLLLPATTPVGAAGSLLHVTGVRQCALWVSWVLDGPYVLSTNLRVVDSRPVFKLTMRAAPVGIIGRHGSSTALVSTASHSV